METMNAIITAPDMMEASINFWFNNSNHIRCPFPDYIKSELATLTKEKFVTWADKLNKEAEKEINDEIMVEKFEEMLFETALHMVKTEDERITIQYPFMLRIGDEVDSTDKENEVAYRSKVTERKVVKRDDSVFLKVTLQSLVNKEFWETEFEIAA